MAPNAPLNATALIRCMDDKPPPGMGVLPPDWLHNTFLATAARRSGTTDALNSFSFQ